jgi:hypothetical protein
MEDLFGMPAAQLIEGRFMPNLGCLHESLIIQSLPIME